jgi:3-methyl-2-oxobutanoate hydroxymethyltransferase
MSVPQPPAERVTLRVIDRMAAAGAPFACLTCYDATTARWLERAGVHVLLVGDSAAEVILGHARTIDVSLDFMLAITAAVKRGAPSRLVMGDMPFMSYQADEGRAVENAGRFLTEGHADIVKIEADRTFAPLVARMVRAGIPVCGHVGSRPQTSALTSGYAAAGRTAAEAEAIVADAVALEQAGCQVLLVEAVPDAVTERILARTRAPLIGIGAGPACHGQVLVLHDLLGLSDRPPRFAEPAADLGRTIADAAAQWVRRVAERRVGGERYNMKPGEADKLATGAPRPPANGHPASPAVGAAPADRCEPRAGARDRAAPRGS